MDQVASYDRGVERIKNPAACTGEEQTAGDVRRERLGVG